MFLAPCKLFGFYSEKKDPERSFSHETINRKGMIMIQIITDDFVMMLDIVTYVPIP